MSVTTYSNARKNFKSLIKQVNEDNDAITITTKENENAVLISESEYNKYIETIYLLQNSANAKRLNESIEQLEKGDLKEVSIDE